MTWNIAGSDTKPECMIHEEPDEAILQPVDITIKNDEDVAGQAPDDGNAEVSEDAHGRGQEVEIRRVPPNGRGSSKDT